jgi:hypothetical protein
MQRVPLRCGFATTQAAHERAAYEVAAVGVALFTAFCCSLNAVQFDDDDSQYVPRVTNPVTPAGTFHHVLLQSKHIHATMMTSGVCRVTNPVTTLVVGAGRGGGAAGRLPLPVRRQGTLKPKP